MGGRATEKPKVVSAFRTARTVADPLTVAYVLASVLQRLAD